MQEPRPTIHRTHLYFHKHKCNNLKKNSFRYFAFDFFTIYRFRFINANICCLCKIIIYLIKLLRMFLTNYRLNQSRHSLSTYLYSIGSVGRGIFLHGEAGSVRQRREKSICAVDVAENHRNILQG